MAVQVEEVMPAKTGKSLRVKLGGNWYGASLDSGLNGAKGKMIEADIVTGKFGPWINAWKESTVAAPPTAAPIPAATPPLSAGAAPRYAEQNPNVAPWWAPMASNVIAHAIQAGKIETPDQIGIWFNAVKGAAQGQQSNEVDDDIPF